jgi:hypothetical protein
MSSSGTESDSSASSDVDFDYYGAFGYQLEPQYTEEELRQMKEAASAQRLEIENNPRQNDTNWCSCSKCISLPLPLECLCCHEFSLFDGQLELSDCIIDNTNFRTVYLNPVVLETSYNSFLRYKRHRGRAPDVLTNRQSRLMAYRQFVCWVRKGQPLGKKYRVTLPACVVKIIREEFPSPDGNYEGFRVCM